MPMVLKKKTQPKPQAVVVTSQHLPGKESHPLEKTVELGVPADVLASDGPFAAMGVGLSRKVSDGNYGSFGFSSWATIPCVNTPEARKHAMDLAMHEADTRITHMMAGLTFEADTKKG